MATPLASLSIRGFRSIDAVELVLSSEVTLLIGANGSGKSNIVDAFELLGKTLDGQLQAAVASGGGFDRLLHRGVGGMRAEQVVITAWDGWRPHTSYGQIRNGYEMTLLPGIDDSARLLERTFMHGEKYDVPSATSLGESRESSLQGAATRHYANEIVLRTLSGCRVFHFDDTSVDAPPLRATDIGNNLTLLDDARNLASVLLDARTYHRDNYDRIVRSVQTVAPFFADFVLEPQGDRVSLRWREHGVDDVFAGSALSSGTLRFICLATLLQQPNPPATIVLDEPELGLHPAAIRHLSELLRIAGQGRRIVAATQSVTLLGNFSIDEVAVVERVGGATTLARPDADYLRAWLDDYSLGDLWEMNLLGGQPRAAAASRRAW